MSKGLFITLEGGEGAGKTTQINRLRSALMNKGQVVAVTREPGGTPAAEALRTVFIEQKGNDWPVPAQALLMMAARTLHVQNVIRPALESGKIVISDRFMDSTRAYQGHALGMDLRLIEALKQMSFGSLEPDLTFIFDIDPRVGLKRTESRKEKADTFEAKELDFHDRLRSGFLQIAKDNPGRCAIIDATKPIDEIAETILEKVWTRVDV